MYRGQPNVWLLRLVVALFALGTVPYVERDVFHQDDSLLQPILEVSSVVFGALLVLCATLAYRPKLFLSTPYALFVGTFLLALASSTRSWDPLFSLTRGGLLLLISVSAAVLLQIYGLKAFLRSLLNAYVIVVLFGLVAGLAAPEIFPLILSDPGEETLRARLHLFKIHPTALADDCAIALIVSVLFRGHWAAFCRLVLATCLLLTVGRSSILFGLPLYLLAETLQAGNLSSAIKRLRLIGAAAALIILATGAVASLSDGNPAQDLQDTVVRLIDATKDNTTLNGRTTLWNMLIADLSPDNLYGYGVGGARYYLRTVNPWFSHSHNSALETIYISGYLGLGLMTASLAGSLWLCASQWRRPSTRVLFVGLCYVIAAGMMNTSWYDTSSLLILSIACNANRAVEEQAQQRRLMTPLRVAPAAWSAS